LFYTKEPLIYSEPNYAQLRLACLERSTDENKTEKGHAVWNMYSQVLEDALNQQRNYPTVKVFNFGASAYSVKQMEGTP